MLRHPPLTTTPPRAAAVGGDRPSDVLCDALDLVNNVYRRLKRLGVTKDGAPRHPLYLKADQPLEAW